MADALLKGIAFGLLLAVMMGPVFFSLIQNSIHKGPKAGIFMALGISISDASYIFLVYFGIKQLKDNPMFGVSLGLAGGLIMLVFGIVSLVKKAHANKGDTLDFQPFNPFRQIMKGFMLNGINPFVLLFWVGIMSMVSVSYQYTNEQIITFFVTIIVTVLCTDILKVFLSNRLRKWITPKRMQWMNRIVGIALIIFALRLFFYAYTHY